MITIILVDNLDITIVGKFALAIVIAGYINLRFFKRLKQMLVERKWDSYIVKGKIVDVSHRMTTSRNSQGNRVERFYYTHTYEFVHPQTNKVLQVQSGQAFKNPKRHGFIKEVTVRISEENEIRLYEDVKGEILKVISLMITITLIAIGGAFISTYI